MAEARSCRVAMVLAYWVSRLLSAWRFSACPMATGSLPGDWMGGQVAGRLGSRDWWALRRSSRLIHESAKASPVTRMLDKELKVQWHSRFRLTTDPRCR